MNNFKFNGDIEINRFGYGAMHLTGYGMWGPPANPQAAIELLRHAVHDLGINFIDTADSYGPGDNENIICKALYPYPENLVISTKGGMLRSGKNDWIHDAPGSPYIKPLGRPEYLRQQVEMSLRRLKLECIPLYQLHSVDPLVPLEDSLGELVRLREEGKIKLIGLSNQPGVTLEQLDLAYTVANIASVENLYNIVDRSDDAVLERAQELGVAFIPWFPLGHGSLTGETSPLFPIAKKYQLSPSQLGLAWLLNRSENIILIPGTTSVKHLDENYQARSKYFSDTELAEIICSIDELKIPVWRPSR